MLSVGVLLKDAVGLGCWSSLELYGEISLENTENQLDFGQQLSAFFPFLSYLLAAEIIWLKAQLILLEGPFAEF